MGESIKHNSPHEDINFHRKRVTPSCGCVQRCRIISSICCRVSRTVKEPSILNDQIQVPILDDVLTWWISEQGVQQSAIANRCDITTPIPIPLSIYKTNTNFCIFVAVKTEKIIVSIFERRDPYPSIFTQAN